LSYISNVLFLAMEPFRPLFVVFPYLFGLGPQRKVVTEEYPDPTSSKSPEVLPLRFRGHLINDMDKCIGCGDCSSVCPQACLKIEASDVPNREKKWVSVFDIDLSLCISCGLCVDACPAASLTHSKEFRIISDEKAGLVLTFGLGVLNKERIDNWDKKIKKDLV